MSSPRGDVQAGEFCHATRQRSGHATGSNVVITIEP
jgi:hypothetical protein